MPEPQESRNQVNMGAILRDPMVWKLVTASIIGGLVVAWLAPVLRRLPPK